MSILGLIMMAVVGTTIWDTIVRDHDECIEAEVEEEEEEETYTLVDSGVRVSVKFLSDKE